MDKKIAFFYSRLFDPILIFAVIPFLSVILKNDLTTIQTAKWLTFVFTVGGAIPLIYYSYLLLSHRISDIELREKRERNGILLFLAICWWMVYLFTLYINGPKLVQATYLSVSIVMILYFLINHKIKVSGHSGALTALTIYLSILVSPIYLFGFLAVAGVFWARRTLNLHTYPELLLGMIICGGVVMTILKIFGY